MIRETRSYEVYPSKSVIEDIVTRDGLPTEDSFTPFSGKKSVLEEQFSGKQRSVFKLFDFLSFVKNRDLNPAACKVSAKYGILEDSSRVAAGWRTLEDMFVDGQEASAVKEYLVMLCVGFKKDKESPYRKTQVEYTRTVRNYDGDDEETEEKYLLERSRETISNEEYEETLREIPYLIKSIWNYSKQYQGNLFSFAFAYADIVERKNGRADVNIQDFRNYRMYCINKDGSFKKVFVHSDDNKYTIYPALTKIFIAPGSYQAEYNMCMKFLNSLKVLGIDYHDEDPMQFNNEFMAKLVCTYLPGNEQYFREYGDVDPEIIIALKPENIFATSRSAVYIPTNARTNAYDNTQTIYFISESLDMSYKLWCSGRQRSDLFNDHKAEALELLTQYLRVYSGNPNINAPVDKLVFHPTNGILYMKNSDSRSRGKVQEYLILDGKPFGTFKGSYNYNVILTRYGFVIALEEDFDKVYYLPMDKCFEALEVRDDYEQNSGKEHWRALGIYGQ